MKSNAIIKEDVYVFHLPQLDLSEAPRKVYINVMYRKQMMTKNKLN